MNILMTGSLGFLGKEISSFLHSADNKIISLGIEMENDINCDLSKEIPIIPYEIDTVIHAAGKAHLIPKNNKEKQSFFNVNVQGTRNLCFSLEKSKLPKAIIFISTVAVYGVDSGLNITEEHDLLGTTPYALSKIQAEKFLTGWCLKNNITLGIVRPSLIAGKNPPGNLGMMINAIKNGRYLSIGDGKTRKSVLIAEDIARLIPKLSEVGGIYNVCDDTHPSFAELESLMMEQLERKKLIRIPYWSAKLIALVGDLLGDKFPINSLKLSKIVKPLIISNKKAKRELNWQPLDVLSNFKIK